MPSPIMGASIVVREYYDILGQLFLQAMRYEIIAQRDISEAVASAEARLFLIGRRRYRHLPQAFDIACFNF